VDDLILKKTLDVWQPHSEKKLTEEDARQIIQNLTGFFETLARWDRESNAGQDEVNNRDGQSNTDT